MHCNMSMGVELETRMAKSAGAIMRLHKAFKAVSNKQVKAKRTVAQALPLSLLGQNAACWHRLNAKEEASQGTAYLRVVTLIAGASNTLLKHTTNHDALCAAGMASPDVRIRTARLKYAHRILESGSTLR